MVDAEQKLIGTVTDGDIRRGLLRGVTLESPAEQVMHRKFCFVREGVEEQEVLAMMSREVLHQIPVLDSEGRVVRLFLLEDLLQQTALPNTVVIMAGGEGKRLRPLTKNCPKPMLPVQGSRSRDSVGSVQNAGFRQFYFAVLPNNRSSTTLVTVLMGWTSNIWRRLNMDCRCALASENPRRSLLVLNGDVLTQVPFPALLRFHQETGCGYTMCSRA